MLLLPGMPRQAPAITLEGSVSAYVPFKFLSAVAAGFGEQSWQIRAEGVVEP